ncbi:hypothetical protein CDIK_3857 [Cucumispora dikerogammari]|nr:hypothetical protein CDIK_3857 [Cucumispora dikerogammari]
MLQNTITTLVAQDSALNQRGISESLGLIGTTLSQSAVSRKLKAYQLTWKKLTLVPAKRNSPRIIELRFNYAREISLYQTGNWFFSMKPVSIYTHLQIMAILLLIQKLFEQFRRIEE